jgi:hypothetical protein
LVGKQSHWASAFGGCSFQEAAPIDIDRGAFEGDIAAVGNEKSSSVASGWYDRPIFGKFGDNLGEPIVKRDIIGWLLCIQVESVFGLETDQPSENGATIRRFVGCGT